MFSVSSLSNSYQNYYFLNIRKSPQETPQRNPWLNRLTQISFVHWLPFLKPENSVVDQSKIPRQIISRTGENLDVSLQKMWKNSKKAIEEHRKKDKEDCYASVDDVLFPGNLGQRNVSATELNLSYTVAEAQGPRDSMEDAHFFGEIDQGTLAGVFDGHGGKKVAEFASIQFQKRFSETLKQSKQNVRLAFETLIHQIHEEVAEHGEWDSMGSTALVCFIDKKSRLIYTATVGDSEANLYRTVRQGLLKSIPLSCVRDWSSRKDSQRAAFALNQPEIAVEWPKTSHPKQLRFPFLFHGVNVSRVIGDMAYADGDIVKPAFVHKPKITVHQLQPGDLVTLTCDGLKDYVPEHEILNQISQRGYETNLAQHLVDYAVEIKQAHDNVTVLAIKVS